MYHRHSMNKIFLIPFNYLVFLFPFDLFVKTRVKLNVRLLLQYKL